MTNCAHCKEPMKESKSPLCPECAADFAIIFNPKQHRPIPEVRIDDKIFIEMPPVETEGSSVLELFLTLLTGFGILAAGALVIWLGSLIITPKMFGWAVITGAGVVLSLFIGSFIRSS